MGYPAPAYRGGQRRQPGGSQNPDRRRPYRPSRSPARAPLGAYRPLAKFALGRILWPLGLALSLYGLWQLWRRVQPYQGWTELNSCHDDRTLRRNATLTCGAVSGVPSQWYPLGGSYNPDANFVVFGRVSGNFGVVTANYQRNPGTVGEIDPVGATVALPVQFTASDFNAQPHVRPRPWSPPAPWFQPLVPWLLPILQPWFPPAPVPYRLVPQLPDVDPFGDPARGPGPAPAPVPVPRPGDRPGPDPWAPLDPGVRPLPTPDVPLVPDIVLSPRTGPSVRPNSHRNRPPRRREKERKMRTSVPVARRIAAVLGEATEIADFVDCLWQALPRDVAISGRGAYTRDAKTRVKGQRTTPQQKLADLYRNIQHLDIAAALTGCVENELEDQVLGRLGKAASRARANADPGAIFGPGSGPGI